MGTRAVPEMKVLFVSNYKDKTGWGYAGLNYILALDKAGVDVVCRPLKLNDSDEPLPERIYELESKSSKGCDICIQHCLPHYLSYGDFKKNIALYVAESSNFECTVWPERINMMDAAWVPNLFVKHVSFQSEVKVPIRVIPHTFPVENYLRSYKVPDEIKKLKDEGKFIFYTIGEFTRRKNYAALIKAFQVAFCHHDRDKVALVIKTSKDGVSAEETKSGVIDFCNGIKPGLKLYGDKSVDSYLPETIITRRFTDNEIYGLHYGADCYVTTSYGESWGIGAFDAMGFGKTPIVPKSSGFTSYMTSKCGWLVETQEDICFGVDDTFRNLMTGHEMWWSINIPELIETMIEAYEKPKLRESLSIAGMKRAQGYSYENVGNRMKYILENF